MWAGHRPAHIRSCEATLATSAGLCHHGRVVGGAAIGELVGVRVHVWTPSTDLAERGGRAVRALGGEVLAVDSSSGPTPFGDDVEVLVVDRSLPGWLGAVADVVKRCPMFRPLLFGDVAGPDEFLASVAAGVVGFCPGDATAGALERSIRSVAESGASIPRSFTKPLVDLARRGRVVRTAAGDIAVTDREWAILQLLVQRRSTQEIADEMFVSTGTVRSHISTLVRKLGAVDRDDVVALVLRGPGRSTS